MESWISRTKWLPRFDSVGRCLSRILEYEIYLESSIKKETVIFLKRTIKETYFMKTNLSFPIVLNDRKETMGKVATVMERWTITKVISVDIWWSLIYLWKTVFCQERSANASSKYQKTGANLCLSGFTFHRFKSLLLEKDTLLPL